MKRVLLVRGFGSPAVTKLVGALLIAASSPSAEQADTNKIIPLIVMDDVPLNDAIANLARQAGINIILDPQLTSQTRQSVSGRWQNTTAEQLLGALLKEHKMGMIENPTTAVARIVSTNKVIAPLPNQARENTNNIVPLISMQAVPLDVAINKLASQAQLQITLDPELWKSSSAIPTVSFRWENLTSKQALAALLDNHDLEIMEDPATVGKRIVLRKKKVEN